MILEAGGTSRLSRRVPWRLLGSANEALFKSPECALLKKQGPFSVLVCAWLVLAWRIQVFSRRIEVCLRAR